MDRRKKRARLPCGCAACSAMIFILNCKTTAFRSSLRCCRSLIRLQRSSASKQSPQMTYTMWKRTMRKRRMFCYASKPESLLMMRTACACPPTSFILKTPTRWNRRCTITANRWIRRLRSQKSAIWSLRSGNGIYRVFPLRMGLITCRI